MSKVAAFVAIINVADHPNGVGKLLVYVVEVATLC
jgi:hypothetical protein